MKRIAYYHVYLTENLSSWMGIVLEQMKAMEDTGLLASLDKLKVTCIAREDGSKAAFTDLMQSDWNTPGPLNIELDFVQNPFHSDEKMITCLNDPGNNITENITYQKMWDDAWDKKLDQALYIHTKGITSMLLGPVEKIKKYYYWRQYLQYGVIEHWKDCVEALKTHDVAGINFYDDPSPHFSGGMFWATADHLRNLPEPITNEWWKNLQEDAGDGWLKTCSERFKDEMWVCMPTEYKMMFGKLRTKIFNFQELPQKYNPASILLPRGYYAK